MLHALLVAQSAGDTTEEVLGVVQTGLEYAGTVAFAISGALLAGRKRMDVAGVVALGCIVGVGGGTIRDLLLGQTPVFWVRSPAFVLVAALTALLTLPLYRYGAIQWGERLHLIRLTDAAGMALFVIISASVAIEAGASPISAAILVCASFIFGGSRCAFDISCDHFIISSETSCAHFGSLHAHILTVNSRIFASAVVVGSTVSGGFFFAP